MRLVRIVPFFVFIICSLRLAAQLPSTPEGVKQPRILIVLDGSSSMLNPWEKDLQRFGAAAKVVSALMDSVYAVNNQVEFALRVYGHQYPAQENNCTDTKREVMFSKDNYTQMALRLASLHPSGVSPIAFALKEAATNDLQDELHNAYSIILITDGGESCNGDICDVVRTLIANKIFFKPYIISLLDYAPLRTQYACLGSYLTVGKEADIAPAVSSIVSDYRPMLKSPILVATKPEAPKVRQPEMSTVAIPKFIPDHSPVSTINIVLKDKMPEMFHYNIAIQPIAKTEIRAVKIDLPFEAAAVVSPVPSTPITHPRIARDLRRLPVPKIPLAVIDKPETELPAFTNATVVIGAPSNPIVYRRAASKPRLTPLSMAPLAVIDKPAPEPPKVAAVVPTPPVTPKPPVVKEEPQPAPKTTVVTIKSLPPVATTTPKPKPEETKPKEVAFTSSSENSSETGTRIYFTDGHGTFYKTSPKLQLTDAKGNVVKQFYRTIDAAGNPDLLPLPGGTYNLVVPGRRNSVLRNVVLQADKVNKVVAVVSNGSLAFEYPESPGTPVEEFEATVNILFEPGPTIRQKCSLELEYVPGNYHVEVNTLPVSKYNVDIDFANTSVLPVKVPGFVQFTNTTALGKVALYYPLGDRFMRFFIMELNGNPANQKLRLQPGAYEVHWVKNPPGGELVQRFTVKSHAITEIELH